MYNNFLPPWSWNLVRVQKHRGERGRFISRMHIQMRGLNCLSYWRIVLRECWEVACVFPLKADFWTAGAGAGGCFASISLGPWPLLPLLMRLWQHSKSSAAVITSAHASKGIITPFKTTLSLMLTSAHVEWSPPPPRPHSPGENT